MLKDKNLLSRRKKKRFQASYFFATKVNFKSKEFSALIDKDWESLEDLALFDTNLEIHSYWKKEIWYRKSKL